MSECNAERDNFESLSTIRGSRKYEESPRLLEAKERIDGFIEPGVDGPEFIGDASVDNVEIEGSVSISQNIHDDGDRPQLIVSGGEGHSAGFRPRANVANRYDVATQSRLAE